ncbi:MAG: WD40 repeat domain-containing protein, partial [Gemmata sp.]
AKLDEGLRAVASIAAQVWASAQDHYAAQEQAELAASGLYFSQMRDVGRLWKTEPSIGAKQLANTNNCPDRLREVCWGVLARLCREYLTLTGQPGTALAVSRDGTIVALGTAGNDAAVHLLDADTGRLRKKLAGHTDKVAAVAFAAAADELASASEDGTVRLWDAATFTARTTLKAGTPLQSVALAPDAKWVAAGPRGQALDTTKRPTKIKLWRLTGAVEPAPTELIGHEGPIWALATSPDGETLASASSDGTVRLWDTATGNCKSVMNHGGWVLAIAFAADGKSLASGNANGMLRVWSLDGKEERAWQAPGTQSLTFTPDGTLAGAHETVSAGRPNQVMLWDAKAGKLKVSLDLTNSRILCLASAAKGRALVAADEGGTVRFWNASPTEEDLVVPAYRGKGLLSPEAGYAVAYSPSGPEIATGGGVPRGLFNGEVKLWDARTGEPRRVLGTHKGKVLTVAYSPDGGTLVSGAADGSVKVWDTKTGAERAAYRGNAEEIRCVAVANTKRLAASVGKDRVVCVWDLDTGNEKFRMEGHENIVMAAVFAPDDAVLYTASHDKTIRLWDVRNGKERARWVAPDRVVALAMSANGRTLYAGGDNSHVQTWSVERGELLATSIGHTKAVYGIAASRNGRTLASGSADGTVRLWEQDGMREIITLTPVAISVMGLPYEVKGLAFSPDGKALAGIGTDGKLRIWR